MIVGQLLTAWRGHVIIPGRKPKESNIASPASMEALRNRQNESLRPLPFLDPELPQHPRLAALPVHVKPNISIYSVLPLADPPTCAACLNLTL